MNVALSLGRPENRIVGAHGSIGATQLPLQSVGIQRSFANQMQESITPR
jgi:hypothetical protein